MRKRTFTGEYGRLGTHVLARAPWTVPSTLEILADLGRVPSPGGALLGASGDGKLLALESGFFRWLREEGREDRLERGVFPGAALDATPAPRIFGADWCLLEGWLVLPEGVRRAELPRPLPDMRRSAGYEEHWTEVCDEADAAPFLRSLRAGKGLLLGRWGFCSLSLAYEWKTRQGEALRKALESSSGATREAYRKRLEQIGGGVEKGGLANPAGVYGVTWYDCDPGAPKRGSPLAEPARGGCWRDGDTLYGCGERSAGRAVVLPALFDADGTCLGLAAVHSGDLLEEKPGVVLPVHGGAVHLGTRDGDPLGELLPCGGSWSLRLWDGKETLRRGIPADGYVSPLWGHLRWPLVLLAKPPRHLAVLVPLDEGGRTSTRGGTGETVWGWCAPGGATVRDLAGDLLVAEAPNLSVATDTRTFRRHLFPGSLRDGIPGKDGLTLVSLQGEEKEVRRFGAPTTAPGGERFVQEVTDREVRVPWRGMSGEPLELGWWEWPDLGVSGGVPNPSGLGDDMGDNDFREGNILRPRRGLCVTSDGYVYASMDRGSAVGVATFRYEGREWRRSVKFWPVPDTRVAPYGQGGYQVYHYPGTDWSLFHAPVGNVRYQKLIETTDWSFLLPLCGLGGGFALHGALMVQDAFNKYLEDSFGNLMLVYTQPQHRIWLGDAGFDTEREVVGGDGCFWTFAGWAVVDRQPTAIFSRVLADQGWNPTPEVWGVSPRGKKRLDPKDLGALGAAAMSLIPSNYYSRMGLWPGGDLPPGSELLFGSDVFAYPLPPSSGDVGATMAEVALERMRGWQGKTKDLNKPVILSGQVTNHQIFQAATIDPMVPLTDARLMTRDGQTWCLLRHESGVWLGVRCGAKGEKHLLERSLDWNLVSLGTRGDGSVVALFGNGLCGFDIGDSDKIMRMFGFPDWWLRFALWKWPARLLPVVIRQDPGEMGRLKELWTRKES